MYRGSRLYISPVTGSFTKQLMLIVACFVNGSMYAVSGSGTRSMSDSWISWKPRIEDPSNPIPSSNTDSDSSAIGTEKCCISPGRSQNRRSTISVPASLAMAMTSLAVATVPSPLLLDDRQSVGRRGAPSVPVALTLRYAPMFDPGRGAAPAPSAPGPRPGGDGVWGVPGRTGPSRGA